MPLCTRSGKPCFALTRDGGKRANIIGFYSKAVSKHLHIAPHDITTYTFAHHPTEKYPLAQHRPCHPPQPRHHFEPNPRSGADAHNRDAERSEVAPLDGGIVALLFHALAHFGDGGILRHVFEIELCLLAAQAVLGVHYNVVEHLLQHRHFLAVERWDAAVEVAEEAEEEALAGHQARVVYSGTQQAELVAEGIAVEPARRGCEEIGGSESWRLPFERFDDVVGHDPGCWRGLDLVQEECFHRLLRVVRCV